MISSSIPYRIPSYNFFKRRSVLTTRNDITGDAIKSRASTKEFRDNFARIKFGVNKKSEDFHSYPSQQLPTK